MSKLTFYHLFPKNDYISIHNRLFAKIISNSFFDDCIFYFTVVGDKSSVEWERLIMPKNANIRYVENTKHQSESPAFIWMREKVTDNTIKDDDNIFYFHCKGSSQPGTIKWKEHIHKSLHSKFAINNWVDVMCYFLIEKIQEFIPKLNQYGTLGAYPIYRFGDKTLHIAGTTGNIWWVTGDVIKNITKIENLEERPRLYYEYEMIRDILRVSCREYKYMYYVNDSHLSVYTLSSPNEIECVNGYINKEFNDLINFALPKNENNIAVICEVIDAESRKNLENTPQSFNNYKISGRDDDDCLIKIICFGKNRKFSSDFIHDCARRYKNSNIYDPHIDDYKFLIYDNSTVIIPGKKTKKNKYLNVSLFLEQQNKKYEIGTISRSDLVSRNFSSEFIFNNYKNLKTYIYNNEVLMLRDNNENVKYIFRYVENINMLYGYGTYDGYGDEPYYIQELNYVNTHKVKQKELISNKNSTCSNVNTSIISIVYGSDECDIWVDVTDKLLNIISCNNNFIFNLNEELDSICGDPIPGKKKSIKINTLTGTKIIDADQCITL